MRSEARTFLLTVLLALSGAGVAGAQGGKPLAKCPADAVVSGTVCMDRYEASVWRIANPTTTNKALVKKIQAGKARLVDLTKAGATQLGTASDDYTPCADNGTGCADVFALSLPGVTPTSWATWFQAQQACKNARKRLPSNAEWQAAVAGTPGPGPDNGTTDCATNSAGVALTGARSACVSSDGAFDMVGNLYEWVADWVPRSTGCGGSWDSDVTPLVVLQCMVGAATTGEPAALARGGHWGYDHAIGANAGPLSLSALDGPSHATSVIGFRCAR